jgi:hypothetical protein
MYGAPISGNSVGILCCFDPMRKLDNGLKELWSEFGEGPVLCGQR